MRLFSKYLIVSLLIGAFALSGSVRAFTGPGTQSAGSGGGLFYVDANRNIGFGLTNATPAGTFDDNSSGFGYVFTVASTTNPGLSIRNLSANGKTYVWSSRNSGNLSLYREAFGDLTGFPGKVVMDITPIGNVGISVFNPTQRLEVGGNVSSTAFYGSAVNLTSIDPQDFIANSAFATGNYAVNGGLIIGATSTTLIPSGVSLVTTGTSTLATGGGRVGIGTTNPSYLLDINGTFRSNGIWTTPSAVTEWGAAGAAYGALTWSTGYATVYSTAGNVLNFGSNGASPDVTINTSGNVGVGTTAPSSTLHVIGTSTVSSGDVKVATNGFGFVFPDGTKQTTAAAGGNLWTASSTHIYNANAGNVGVGTSVPPKKLTVKLSDAAGTDELLVQDSAGVTQFSVDSDGNVLFAAYPALINFNNAQTNNFNAIVISDPGPGEGLSWSGTAAGWNMDVAPLDRVTNGDGNLNLYGTANNIAAWRPLLFVTTSSTYTTATQSATGLNFTTTGGSGHITFNPGGKVGIGTTTPAYPLEIEPSGGISADMSAGRIQNVGSPVNATDAATRSYVDSSITGGSGSSVGYWTLTGSNLYPNDTAYNVGIGTTTSAVKLTIDTGSSTDSVAIRTNLSSPSTAYYTEWEGASGFKVHRNYGTGGDVNVSIVNDENLAWTGAGGGISLRTTPDTQANLATRLRISPSGNVGIGTITPSGKLNVLPVGTIAGATLANAGLLVGSTTVGIGIDDNEIYANGSNLYIGTVGATTIQFRPGATDRMVITSAGYVGIGTTTPTYPLEIEPVSSISADMSYGRIQKLGSPVSATDAATRSYVDSAVTTGISGTQNYIPKFATANTLANSRIYDNGTNLGIGTSTPSSFLHMYNDFTGQLGLRIENPHTTSDGGVQIALSRGANYRPAQLRFQTINTDEWYVGELYNSGSANTGFNFSPGPNAASSTVTFTSSGIGIGTTSPQAKVHAYAVDGTTVDGFFIGVTRGGGIRSYQDGSDRVIMSLFTKTNAGAVTPRITIDTANSGSVGIGTTTPAYPLEVEPVSSISADMSYGRIQRLGTPVNATDAATRGYVDSTISGGSGSTVGYWTASSTDIYNSNGGNVGVGAASTPNYKLKVFGTFAADSGNIYTDTTGTLTGTAFYDRNNAAYFIDPSAATSMKTLGSVMIGGSGAPGTTLDVAGDVNLNNQALTAAGSLNRGYYVYKSGTTAYGLKLQYTGSEYGTMMFGPNQASRFLSFGKVGAALEDDDMVEYMRIDLDNGNVGIGTNDPGTNKLYVNGATYINGNLALGANNISMTGNIGNVTKLTVTAIDPLYEIDGKKYATYAASVAGGVKEEYVGKGTIIGGEYAIDFRKVEKGSDLWVWYNAVDFSADNIEVLATAYRTPVPIAYEVKEGSIVFHSSYNGTLSFSYRLIGKRHDWKDWPTYAKDQRERPSFPGLTSKKK